MSIKIKYTSEPNLLEQEQILYLLSDAFTNIAISRNTLNGFFSGYKSEYDNFVLLLDDLYIVGVAIVAKRKINLLNSEVDALSVGPIAIAPPFQRKGYSTILIDGINSLASIFGVAVIYLQGIDGFYDRYSYFTCTSKAKLIFEEKSIYDIDGVNLNSMSLINIEKVSTIYTSNASNCSCTSLRTKKDWDWLLKYGSQTWYFYEPTLVLYKGKVIGYFCADPDDPSRVREAVFEQTEIGIRFLLAGLKIHCKQKSIDKVELMTWIDSPLYEFAKRFGNAVFMQFFKNNGSQMMKVHNYSKISEMFCNCFPINYVLENVDGYTLFHIMLEESIFPLRIASKYFPGLICGFYDTKIIENFSDLPKEIQKNLSDFIDNLNPPFFYQGDNY